MLYFSSSRAISRYARWAPKTANHTERLFLPGHFITLLADIYALE